MYGNTIDSPDDRLLRGFAAPVESHALTTAVVLAICFEEFRRLLNRLSAVLALRIWFGLATTFEVAFLRAKNSFLSKSRCALHQLAADLARFWRKHTSGQLVALRRAVGVLCHPLRNESLVAVRANSFNSASVVRRQNTVVKDTIDDVARHDGFAIAFAKPVMILSMLAVVWKHIKVLWAIIVLHPVDVVNRLAHCEATPDEPLHNDNVFCDHTLLITRVIWYVDEHVGIFIARIVDGFSRLLDACADLVCANGVVTCAAAKSAFAAVDFCIAYMKGFAAVFAIHARIAALCFVKALNAAVLTLALRDATRFFAEHLFAVETNYLHVRHLQLQDTTIVRGCHG